MINLTILPWNILCACRKKYYMIGWIIWLLYVHQLESLVIISFLSSFCLLITNSWSQSSWFKSFWKAEVLQTVSDTICCTKKEKYGILISMLWNSQGTEWWWFWSQWFSARSQNLTGARESTVSGPRNTERTSFLKCDVLCVHWVREQKQISFR